MPQRLTTSVTTGFALLFFGTGAALIFAPAEIAGLLLDAQALPTLWLSLLGAALFGFGQMNWMARHALIGGIYGRAVLMGNLAHFLIGGLTLLKYNFDGGLSWAFALVTAVYVLGAGFYTVLFFTSPRSEG